MVQCLFIYFLFSFFPEFGKFDDRQNLSNATSAKSMAALQSAQKCVARAKARKSITIIVILQSRVFILNIPFYFTHFYLRISLDHLLFRHFLLVVQNIPTWSLWLTSLSHKPPLANSPHLGIKISLCLAFIAMAKWLAIKGFL